jgi:2-oxoglutarate ferredoxin oxidoreductase subunit gamma
MKNEIIIAGFGGQGVLFAGLLLAQTALEEHKETSWFPAYGAEMRGGAANSTVMIADEAIGSPVSLRPNVLVALNEIACKRFLPKLVPHGILIINSSLVRRSELALPEKACCFEIPASEIAEKQLGDARVTNLVAIGAFLQESKMLTLASAQKACETVLADKPKLIALKQRALELGYNFRQT